MAATVDPPGPEPQPEPQSEPPPEPLRPWQWPGEWARSEAFWRDVASRTLAGIIVVFVAFTAAVLAGYASGPTARLVVADIYLAAAGVTVAFWAVKRMIRWEDQSGRRRDLLRVLGLPVLVFLPIVAGGAILILLLFDRASG